MPRIVEEHVTPRLPLSMKIAVLNKPTRALKKCGLTFLGREPIHLNTALRQHADYAEALRRMGVHVELLEVNQTHPDAAFIEDTTIILDELAIVTSMGSATRRAEIDVMADVVSGFRRDVRRISAPAHIEGGDVLRVGRTLFVGISPRTNDAGISALEEIARPFGYAVRRVRVGGCLHLKTGITALDDETFVYNSAWIDASPFAGYRLIHVAAEEPWGANVLRIDGRFLGHGTPFQDKAGKWWCTAFVNANVPPVAHSETLKPSVGKNAYTINEQGVTIVPLDVRVLEDDDVRIRAKDPEYADPGPEEAQRFHARSQTTR